MISSDQMLEDAARDGSIDIAEWPRVLESVLQKLHNIVHNEFPLPSLPLPTPLASTIDPEVVASTPPHASSDATRKDEETADAEPSENEPPPNSQSSTKENDAPTDIAAVRPAAASGGVSRTSQPAPQQPPDAIEMQSGTLPPDLLSLYTSSTRMLEYDFAQSPPYTIQRLAELVLRPKNHYRFLPSYLRALDRIVSVSSPVSDFPLPALHAPANGSFLTNGGAQINGISDHEALGSDESLGGALLTPIPWLRHNSFSNPSQSQSQGEGEIHSESTETIEGPNGAGSVETVSVTVNGVPSATSAAHTTPPAPASPTLSEQSDASSSSSSGAGTTDAQLREQGGVTQGELLRQEQEAGVVPLSQSSPRRSLIAGGAAAVGRESAITGMPGAPAPEQVFDSEEQPHARGPEEISVEDMGPQHGANARPGGLDMEAAVGRGRSKSPQPPDNPAPDAEADARMAQEDDAGAPGKDPQDVEKDVEMLKESMEEEKEDEAKDADGDVVVADAAGNDERGA